MIDDQIATRVLSALAGAADELHRAALILRQTAEPGRPPLRSPEDYRRIAGQFSERAATLRAVEAALAEALR